MSRSAIVRLASLDISTVTSQRLRMWRLLLLVVFAITGGAGLVYQVAWTRLLISLFGAGSPAIATILTAFMAGLTLGSLYFGRRIDRGGDGLALYALLEVGIALYAVLLPWAVSETTGFYALIYPQLQVQPHLLNALRFGHAFVLLLFPTFLMGGTLPVLIGFLVREVRLPGRQVALLYGINTIGAAAGCVVAGFILIETLGVRGATWIAAAAQMVAAILVFVARAPIRAAHTPTDLPAAQVDIDAGSQTLSIESRAGPIAARLGSPTLLALITIGYSGFVALAMETLWSRLLTFFLGNTIYSFSVVLATVLTGIALGSLLARRMLAHVVDPLRLLGVLQFIIGLSALLLLPLQWQLNSVRAGVLDLLGDLGWWQLTAAKFVVAAVSLLIPTLAMGASFPCAVQAGARAHRGHGQLVGNVYAVNAFCGALGSLVAGFWLIHHLGVQQSIVMLSLSSMGVGALLLAVRSPSNRRRVIELAGAGAVALILGLLIRVDRPLITIAGLSQGFAPPYRLIDYQEGSTATVAVVEDALGVRELNINGISTAFTSSWDLRIHKLLAVLPLILHPQPERVLIVGYGIGVTARSALAYPTVQQVDVAEISPEVIAVSERFAAVNQGTLADPRLRLIINDGKNHLLATHQRYDMISANAIHPGVAAGNGALYTVDFYAAARDHLAEGGVVCQWLPIHQLSAEDVRTLVRSFQVVFPHTTIWFTSDFALLIGSPQPLGVDLEQLVERLSHPSVAQDLAELDDLAIRGAVDMAGYFLMDEAAVAEYSAGAALNTDDHPIIEFTAPRSAFLSEETNLANLQHLHRFAAPGALPIVKTDTEVQAALQLRGTTNEQVMLGQIATYAGQPDAAMQLYQEALSVDPMNVDARYLAKQQLLTAGVAAEAQGDLQGARAAYEQALALAPTDASAWYRLADVADRLGESDAAGYLEQAVALRPDNARWHVELAAIYSREQQPEQALDQLQTAVSLDPEYGEAHVLLAMFYRQLGEAEKADAALQEALRLQRQMRY